jgi:hypothetical protein
MPDIFTAGAVPINGKSVARVKTAAFTVDIPQGAVVRSIIIRNRTANAVTGGVKVGTTLGGVDVLAAGAVAASAAVIYQPLIGAYNAAAARTLYFDAVTAFNSASLDVAVEWTDIT